MDSSSDIEVTIRRRALLAPDVVALELAPESGTLPPFAAGAHIDVHLPGFVRQYSLCGNPADGSCYQVAVLLEPQSRGGSGAVHALEEGAKLRISPPRNLFSLIEGDEAVLIGGGIGITPLLSMAHALDARGEPFTLHYVLRAGRAAAFEEALKAPPFAGRAFLHRTNRSIGRTFNADEILPSPGPGKHIYICGPTGFMDAVTSAAVAAGWVAESIHREHFNALPVPVGADAFTVVAQRSGVEVKVSPEQTIADALINAGIDVALSCEQGVCGTCLTPIVEGTADHQDLCQTDAEQAEQRMIAVCCSRAKTDRLVLDI